MSLRVPAGVLVAASLAVCAPAYAGPEGRALRTLTEICAPSRDAASSLMQSVDAAQLALGEQRLGHALDVLSKHDTNALQSPAAGVRLLEVDPLLQTDAGVQGLLVISKAQRFEVQSFLENEVHRAALASVGPSTPEPGVARHAMFDRTTPVRVTAPDGGTYPLTLSFDTELPASETFRLFLGDDRLFRTWDGTVAATTLESSGVPLTEFLSDGVNPRLVTFDITQVHIPESWLGRDPIVVTQALRERGFPVTAQWDAVLEIAHESYETIPATYRRLIDRIHTELENPQTHLHLGLPSAAISADQARAIARAVETRAVLRLATQPPVPEVIAAGPEGSILNPTTYSGPVSLELERWPGAHDLEIRQWDHREGAYHTYGLNLLAFASDLAQQHARLWIAEGPFGVSELRIGNLEGALRYAARALSSDEPEIAARLVARADQIHGIDEIDLGLREEIRQELLGDGVLDLLTPQRFLIP